MIEIGTDIDTDGPKVDDIDLDEAISKAMAGNTATAETDMALEEIEAKDTPPAQERARDEKGRFAPKPETTEPVTEAVAPEGVVSEETSKAEPPKLQTEQPQPQADASAIADGDKFRGWSKDHQAAFSKLPAEAQQFVMARQQAERDYAQSKFGEFAQYRETVSPLVEIATSNADYFRQNGVANPIEAIRNLVSTEQTLRHGTWAQKQATLDMLARTYLGVPFSPPEVDEFVEDPRDPRSPHYAHWHDQQVRSQQTENELRQLKAQLESQEKQQAISHVEQFAQATNPDGSPTYPYFDLVRGQMGKLFAEGKTRDIREAYKIAVAPIEQRLAAEAAGRQQKAERDRLAALEKAKRAAPIRTSGIAPGGRTQVSSVDEAISSAMASIGRR